MTTATMDYKVKDLSLAEFGAQEIAIARDEMPGLSALREERTRRQNYIQSHIVVAGMAAQN